MWIPEYKELIQEHFPLQLRGDGPLFNPRFRGWQECIEEEFAEDGEGKFNPKYGLGNINYSQDPELLEASLKHIQEHRRTKQERVEVVLVHPYYLLQKSQEAMTPQHRIQAEVYLNNLMTILNASQDNAAVGLTIFEDLYNYSSLTSLLLESGNIDNVVLTTHGRGSILNPADLEYLNGKKVFVGGGYNGECFTYACGNIRKNCPDAEIVPVKGAVIISPHRFDSLFYEKLNTDAGANETGEVISVKGLISVIADEKKHAWGISPGLQGYFDMDEALDHLVIR